MTIKECPKCGKKLEYDLGIFHCACGHIISIFEIPNYIKEMKDYK